MVNERLICEYRVSCLEVFCQKPGVKIFVKLSEEHFWWSLFEKVWACSFVTLIKKSFSQVFRSSRPEVFLGIGENMQQIFRTAFPKNTSGWLHLGLFQWIFKSISEHLFCMERETTYFCDWKEQKRKLFSFCYLFRLRFCFIRSVVRWLVRLK